MSENAAHSTASEDTARPSLVCRTTLKEPAQAFLSGRRFVGLRATRHAAHVPDAGVELQTIAASIELPLHALAEEAGGLKTKCSCIHIADVDGHGDRAVGMRIGHCHLQVTHAQL